LGDLLVGWAKIGRDSGRWGTLNNSSGLIIRRELRQQIVCCNSETTHAKTLSNLTRAARLFILPGGADSAPVSSFLRASHPQRRVIRQLEPGKQPFHRGIDGQLTPCCGFSLWGSSLSRLRNGFGAPAAFVRPSS
jgi:hypothetical protein